MRTTALADFTMGDRIKIFREQRGLSQKTLGELVARTENWMYKVERGIVPVDRISVLIDIARALNLRDLSDLTGGFLQLAVDGRPVAEHPSVPAIRKILALPTSMLGKNLDADPLTPEELEMEVAGTLKVYDTAKLRYTVVGDLLPPLLHQAYATLRAASGAAELNAVRGVISLYSLYEVWLRRVGEFDLARVAADRGVGLADDTGDPMFQAAAAWKMACVLTSSGYPEDSLDLANQMIEECAPGENARPEHLSAYGALHLQGAVAAVRASKVPTGWDLLRNADRIAQQLGGDYNHWNTCFGPTNVAMHSVHLAAEEGNPAEALRLADSVVVGDNQPMERKTRYLLELMNCNRVQRDDYATVYLLKNIKDLSPEEITFSPLAREAVTDLMKREKPMWVGDLREIAVHMGLISAA